tara:strand:+ start:467 stop:1030 length:564 start_codon:yes stop_codon:yes gene_type:complete
MKDKTFKENDYDSNDGILTTIWGPAMWHFLHSMSFNYPNNPTKTQKKNYKEFIFSLKNVLPCGSCRKNLKKNLKKLPLKNKDLKNRYSFSLWVYNLHELINKMLHKKSNLTYDDVRERYEHFRARCTKKKTKKKIKKKKFKKCKTKKENGCVEPYYGIKSKCILSIVPQNKNIETLKINKKCIKKKI